jgi:hypothetical protein
MQNKVKIFKFNINIASIMLFAVLFLIFSNIFAQAPQKMSYQVVVRDGDDTLIKNQIIAIQVSILQNTNSIYVETHSVMTNNNGLASLEIGGGNVITGNFSEIDWSLGSYFIKTEIDLTGGTNYTITGTSQLLSVPYALYAANGGIQGPPGMCGFTHFIGEKFGGGIVVSVWKENGIEKGLIASLDDLSSSQEWSNVTDTIGAAAQNPMDGRINTAAIIAQAGHVSSAASLCANYTAGGLNDWYLPAAWELNKLYNIAFEINNILENDGDSNTKGFELNSYYWSSTENYFYNAWYQYFFAGYQTLGSEFNKYRVRAVRRFEVSK